MVAALGIATSLLSDIGFKAMKGLTSGQNGAKSAQDGMTDPSSLAGQFVPGERVQASIGKLIAPYDTDGDGKLNKEEFLAIKTKIDSAMSALLKTQEDSGAADTQTNPGDRLFARIDKNGDGSITSGELARAFVRAYHHIHKGDVSDQGVSQAPADGSSSTDSTS